MLDPATVGVLSNPAGRHNARGGLKAVEAVLATAPAVSHRLAREPRAIETALAELAAAGVRHLAVNGGRHRPGGVGGRARPAAGRR